ncbi:MAG: ribosome maturation factor RimP [Parasporobacterium sp.]|nr:ribosome maturation factor RimP [Parasporobacterium sp.]
MAANKNSKVEERTEILFVKLLEKLSAEPDENGSVSSYEMVDVEYVKEGGNWYLRLYADKEGGISINDCERISRAIELDLDKEDFIPDAYILEVSSPGLTRPLKKERDYERNLGKPVEVHLYKPIEMEKEKVKVFIGDLKAYDDRTVTLDIGEDAEEIVVLEKTNISIVKQYVVF